MVQSELNLGAKFKIYSFFSMKSPCIWMISFVLSSPACMHVGKHENSQKKNTTSLKFSPTVHALLRRINPTTLAMLSRAMYSLSVGAMPLYGAALPPTTTFGWWLLNRVETVLIFKKKTELLRYFAICSSV